VLIAGAAGEIAERRLVQPLFGEALIVGHVDGAALHGADLTLVPC